MVEVIVQRVSTLHKTIIILGQSADLLQLYLEPQDADGPSIISFPIPSALKGELFLHSSDGEMRVCVCPLKIATLQNMTFWVSISVAVVVIVIV